MPTGPMWAVYRGWDALTARATSRSPIKLASLLGFDIERTLPLVSQSAEDCTLTTTNVMFPKEGGGPLLAHLRRMTTSIEWEPF